MRGTRYNEGKPKLSLVFEADLALAGCAKVLMYGLVKYSRGNWLKGLKYTELCDSLGRHMTAFMAGQDLDVGPAGQVDNNYSGLPHVDLMLCNALFLSQMYHGRRDMDDRNKPMEIRPKPELMAVETCRGVASVDSPLALSLTSFFESKSFSVEALPVAEVGYVNENDQSCRLSFRGEKDTSFTLVIDEPHYEFGPLRMTLTRAQLNAILALSQASAEFWKGVFK